MAAPVTVTYNPSIFNVPSMDAAMAIILTPEGGVSTEKRWLEETPHICGLIQDQLEIDADSVVLDYGCGVGRLAQMLIQRTGCFVVGADISASMRALAASYVNSDRFAAVHPAALPVLGRRFNAAFSVWTLQHCFNPLQDINRIADLLDGKLLVVNNTNRCVPTPAGWVDDKRSIQADLATRFKRVNGGRLSSEAVPEILQKNAFWWVGKAPQ